MRPAVVAPLVAALAACATASSPRGVAAPSARTDLAIRGVTVVDVERGALLADRTVMVRGGRIVSVDSGAARALPAGATVVDGRWLDRAALDALLDRARRAANPAP